MRNLIALGLIAISIAANADVCPEKGEVIHTIPYSKKFECPASSIVISGRLNPEKYQTCLGDVPIAQEDVWFASRGGKPEVLPSVRALSRPTDRFLQTKVWTVGNVKCEGSARITILYSGGGNCDQCEKSVQYDFDRRGRLKKPHIR